MVKPDQETAIARADIAERVEEAWDTLRRLPDREREALRQAARGQSWPGMLYDAAEHAAWEKSPMRRPPPDAAKITRMEEVLDWLLALSKMERKYVNAVWLFCAKRLGPVEAGKLLGCHRETATIWRDAGLDRIAQLRRSPNIESKRLSETLKDGMSHPLRRFG